MLLIRCDYNNKKDALFQMHPDDDRVGNAKEIVGEILGYGKEMPSELNGHMAKSIIVNGEAYEVFSEDWSVRKK
jgi:hypothetical protein